MSASVKRGLLRLLHVHAVEQIGIQPRSDTAGTAAVAGQNLITCAYCLSVGVAGDNDGGDGVGDDRISEGSKITNNTLYLNSDAGIEVDGNGSMIKGNILRANGFTGIRMDANFNAIEQNLITDSSQGIRFANQSPQDGSMNFYANNRAFGCNDCYAGAVPSGDFDGGGNVASP